MIHINQFCICCETRVKLFPVHFSCGYSFFPALFIENIFLFPLVTVSDKGAKGGEQEDAWGDIPGC